MEREEILLRWADPISLIAALSAFRDCIGEHDFWKEEWLAHSRDNYWIYPFCLDEGEPAYLGVDTAFLRNDL